MFPRNLSHLLKSYKLDRNDREEFSRRKHLILYSVQFVITLHGISLIYVSPSLREVCFDGIQRICLRLIQFHLLQLMHILLQELFVKQVGGDPAFNQESLQRFGDSV